MMGLSSRSDPNNKLYSKQYDKRYDLQEEYRNIPVPLTPMIRRYYVVIFCVPRKCCI